MQPGIKTKLASLAIAACGALLASGPAHADTLATRCAADTLNPARARLRLEWASACGTTVNVVSPSSPRPPAFAYLNGLTSANGGIPLWEYIETDDFWGRNSYSGVDATVNQIRGHVRTTVGSAATASAPAWRRSRPARATAASSSAWCSHASCRWSEPGIRRLVT
jgi:hypothetical protein